MSKTISESELSKMTAGAISRAIAARWLELVPEERANISRVYEKTYNIVNLHNEGLVTPTRASRDRLINLYLVVCLNIERQQTSL